jgi:hypothetical protein
MPRLRRWRGQQLLRITGASRARRLAAVRGLADRRETGWLSQICSAGDDSWAKNPAKRPASGKALVTEFFLSLRPAGDSSRLLQAMGWRMSALRPRAGGRGRLVWRGDARAAGACARVDAPERRRGTARETSASESKCSAGSSTTPASSGRLHGQAINAASRIARQLASGKRCPAPATTARCASARPSAYQRPCSGPIQSASPYQSRTSP